MFDFDRAKAVYTGLKEQMDGSMALLADVEKMTKIPEMRLVDHAEVFLLLRKCNELVKEMSAEYGKLANHVAYKVLPDVMFQQGTTSVKTASGYRVTINTRFNAKMLDKEAAHQWLKDNELGDIITETVNAQTLSSQLRQLIEQEGMEPPAEIFEVGTSSYASVTKAG